MRLPPPTHAWRKANCDDDRKRRCVLLLLILLLIETVRPHHAIKECLMFRRFFDAAHYDRGEKSLKGGTLHQYNQHATFFYYMPNAFLLVT
jgi:hypothetical protein